MFKSMKLQTIILVALTATVLLLTSAKPKPKGTASYDGITVSGALEKVLDWDSITEDKKIKYVYFDITVDSTALADTSSIVKNVSLAREKGLKTGMSFVFNDKYKSVYWIKEYLTVISPKNSDIAPIIAIPEESGYDRRVVHRYAQIWANVLKKFYGEDPILRASRDDCRAFLAPVLTTHYRICLLSDEPFGYMIQHTKPYERILGTDIKAFPTFVTGE